MLFREKLNQKAFTLTLEIDPPRGSGVKKILKEIEPLIPHVDALNIACCPVAKLRMDPMAFGAIVAREFGVETILHITMRDMSLLGLQSWLIGCEALNLSNFLVMTGDAPKHSNIPETKGVFQGNSMVLMKIMKKMNQGLHSGGGKLNKKSRLYFGATANPTAINLINEAKKMQKKVDAGASFFQTQPVFQMRTVREYLKVTEEVTAPSIIGTMLLKDYESSLWLNQNVPGLFVPSEILARLKKNNHQDEALQVVTDFLRDGLNELGGLHLFPMNNYGAMRELLAELKTLKA